MRLLFRGKKNDFLFSLKYRTHPSQKYFSFVAHGFQNIMTMINAKFNRLIKRGTLSQAELEKLVRESTEANIPLEELLLQQGVPKHEILFSLSEYYGLPFVEYDESVAASYFLVLRLDFHHHVIGVVGRVDCGHPAGAIGAVERVLDLLRRNAEAGRLVAVDIN